MISNTWYLGVLWASILVLGQHKPLETAVEVTNDFSICILQVIATPKANAIFSPYGLVSVSVLIYEGANRSSTSAQQIERALRLPANANTTKMGFRDLHMTMRASKYFTSDGFLRGLVLSNPKAVLHRSYLDKLKYYGFEPDISILTTTATPPTTLAPNKTTDAEVIGNTTVAPTTTKTTTAPTTTSGEDGSTETSGSTEAVTPTPPDASVETKDGGRTDLDTAVAHDGTSGAVDTSSSVAEDPVTSSGESSESSKEPLTEAPPSMTTNAMKTSPGVGGKKSTTDDDTYRVTHTPEADSGESASTNTDTSTATDSSTAASGEGGSGGEEEEEGGTSASTAGVDVTNEDASSSIPEQKTEASGITVSNAMMSPFDAQQPETSTMMINNTEPAPTFEAMEMSTIATNLHEESKPPTTTQTTAATEKDVPDTRTTTISTDTAATEESAPGITTTSIPTETTTPSMGEQTMGTDETTPILDAITISPPSMREANEIEAKLGELKALISSSLKENAKRLNFMSKFEKFKELDEQHEKKLGEFDTNLPSSSDHVNSHSNDKEHDQRLSNMSLKTLFSDWVTIVPPSASSNEDYYNFDGDNAERKTITTTDDDIFGRNGNVVQTSTSAVDRDYEDYVSGGSGEDLLMTSTFRNENFGSGTAESGNGTQNATVTSNFGGNTNTSGKNITKRSISGRLRMADWVQENALYRSPPQHWFMTFTGQRMVPVLTLSAFLPFADLPTLGAQAIQIPLDAEFYTLLILIPKHSLGLKQLLYALQWCPLTGIIASLRTTPVYTVVPTFTMVSHINLVNPLMKLGIRDIFDQQRADLSDMSPDPNLFVRSVEQVITISVRKYENSRYRWIDASPSQVQHHVLATHPFVFFVVDSETKVALVSGTMVDPTLWSQETPLHPGYK